MSSLQELAALAPTPGFDAILLCHSLSAEDCERCVSIAEHLWPGAKIISIATEYGSAQLRSTAVVRGLAGPRALLQTLQQVLQPTLSGAGPG